MRNKIFTRIIITTLLCAFLTFSVGKVTRVSAVGTTAVIAGTAFILTGAVYLSYIALTHGEMTLPAAEEMHNFLGGIGRKVSQFPSGAEAYQDIYQGLLRDPTANVIDGVWTWTQDRLKAFANDFSDTRIISDIVKYTYTPDYSTIALNGFNYPWTFTTYPLTVQISIGNIVTFDQLLADGWTITPLDTGVSVIFQTTYPYAHIYPTNLEGTFRNYFNGSRYYVQQLQNDTWSNVTPYYNYGFRITKGEQVKYLAPSATEGTAGYYYVDNIPVAQIPAYGTRPLLPNEVIYDATTGEDLPMVIAEPRTTLPSWVDPDNNNRPIIPWVPIPDIPFDVPTPPGYTGPPQWGFPLAELLDLLEELAEGLIKIDAIARLINEFAGQHGDNYYLEYNDGDTNYYSYYQPTIYDNDTEYVTYNIDITNEQDKIPVDLNTISLYTQNRYLEQIKNSAVAGSSMLRDFAVFWYDVDPEVTYIVFGCCILILIGAFTGKLGHS